MHTHTQINKQTRGQAALKYKNKGCELSASQSLDDGVIVGYWGLLGETVKYSLRSEELNPD